MAHHMGMGGQGMPPWGGGGQMAAGRPRGEGGMYDGMMAGSAWMHPQMPYGWASRLTLASAACSRCLAGACLVPARLFLNRLVHRGLKSSWCVQAT
jgi:hypothetical protein